MRFDECRAMVNAFDPGIPVEEAWLPPSSWYCAEGIAALEARSVFAHNWMAVGRAGELSGAHEYSCVEFFVSPIPDSQAYFNFEVNCGGTMLVRRMARVKYINLINILLGRLAIPELLQDDCRSDNLAEAAARLLSSELERDNQRAAAREALSMLGDGDTAPSDRAAGVILDLIESAPHRGK